VPGIARPCRQVLRHSAHIRSRVTQPHHAIIKVSVVTEYLNPNQRRVEELTRHGDAKPVPQEKPAVNLFDRESKLLSHLDRIVEWRTTGTTAPVMVVIDPTFKCNHRCPGCHGLMGQDTATIPLDAFQRIARQIAETGVKAVSLGGGGDPSCHPQFGEVLRCLNRNGLQVGYYTNGELLRDDAISATIEACSWVRFSLDADGPEIHQLVHRCSPKAFEKVVANMKRRVEARAEAGSDIVLGAGYLVRPDTMSGMYGASKLCRDIGLDYIRIRPFFGYDNKPLCNEEEASEILKELDRCRELQTPEFEVNFPANRISWVASGDPKINYKRCNVHHFSTHIGGDMKVYLCCHTVGWEKYCLGDLNEQSFAEIWHSENRRKIYDSIDYRDCATPCSMSVFNELLHKFEADTIHTNFL
jgi:cyclic pyranopterin phosphate synthase